MITNSVITIHSSRRRFAARLNSSVRWDPLP
nr:b-galactosidase Nterm [Reporter vector p6851]